MSARVLVDTPEAVEALARRLGGVPLDMTVDEFDEAAAMLRRLHARAVEAEDQASRAISAAENWRHETRRTREALATARADALKEAYAAMDSLPDDARLHAERRLSKLISQEPRA